MSAYIAKVGDKVRVTSAKIYHDEIIGQQGVVKDVFFEHFLFVELPEDSRPLLYGNGWPLTSDEVEKIDA